MFKAVIAAALLWSVGVARCQTTDSFSEQVARLLSSIKMPEEELAKVPKILHEVELVLSTHWPGCRVIPFGSTVTGLALVGSDIDANVLLPDRGVPVHGPITYEAAQVLEQFQDYTDILPTFFLVPFLHVPSQTQIHLLFNNYEGARNSALLRYLLNLDNRIKNLTIIVKYWWTKVQKLTEFDTLSSYGMCFMVIFYLQQVNMLPPVIMLQKNAEHFVYDGWNSGFDKIEYKPRNNESLYHLLGGFFEFYNVYNYDVYLISPFVGHPLKRELFKDFESVPNEFEFYRRNVGEKIKEPVDLTDEVYVQDPFVYNKNLAVLLDAQDGSLFKTEFKRLALKYQMNNESSFLDEILSVQLLLQIQSEQS